MKNTELNAVDELFEMYSCTEIVETLETLDLFLYKNGIKQEMSPEFELQYVFIVYLLKRAVRELEPVRQPPRCEN